MESAPLSTGVSRSLTVVTRSAGALPAGQWRTAAPRWDAAASWLSEHLNYGQVTSKVNGLVTGAIGLAMSMPVAFPLIL